MSEFADVNCRLGFLGMDQRNNNIVKFPEPGVNADVDAKGDDVCDDLFTTGAHMIDSLKDEIENRGQMTQGLGFAFDMLLYGLRKPQ